MHETDLIALHLDLPDEAATRYVGEALAPCVLPGMVIYLEGDLGTGKTTLVRALLRRLGHGGAVRSPTYTLVEVYVVSRLYLYHFDFYRFASPEEFLDAGLGEYFHDAAVCLVEWPERAQGCLPPPDLRLCLRHEAVGRRLEALGASQKGASCLKNAFPAPPGGVFCTMPAPR